MAGLKGGMMKAKPVRPYTVRVPRKQIRKLPNLTSSIVLRDSLVPCYRPIVLPSISLTVGFRSGYAGFNLSLSDVVVVDNGRPSATPWAKLPLLRRLNLGTGFVPAFSISRDKYHHCVENLCRYLPSSSIT